MQREMCMCLENLYEQEQETFGFRVGIALIAERHFMLLATCTQVAT